MQIKKAAMAGTLESSDAQVTVVDKDFVRSMQVCTAVRKVQWKC